MPQGADGRKTNNHDASNSETGSGSPEYLTIDEAAELLHTNDRDLAGLNPHSKSTPSQVV